MGIAGCRLRAQGPAQAFGDGCAARWSKSPCAGRRSAHRPKAPTNWTPSMYITAILESAPKAKATGPRPCSWLPPGSSCLLLAASWQLLPAPGCLLGAFKTDSQCFQNRFPMISKPIPSDFRTDSRHAQNRFKTLANRFPTSENRFLNSENRFPVPLKPIPTLLNRFPMSPKPIPHNFKTDSRYCPSPYTPENVAASPPPPPSSSHIFWGIGGGGWGSWGMGGVG